MIDSRTYPALLSHLSSTYPTKSFHLQYSIFSELVHKSGSQTLRDVFLKLLLCTRGLSIEKAVSIQRIFPTPSVLTAAYRSCVTQRERDDLLVNRCDPMLVGRRKIGKALSKKVADVWWGRYGNIPEALED